LIKRIVFFVLLIAGVLLVITGIGEGAEHEDEPMVLHIVTAIVFVLACMVHLVLNRKAMVKYIRGGK
jgi:drug/metabolite transporter (DMT)-like permease